MSRLIDRLPEPEKKLEKKVIVLSRSRVGTFSLYQAMKMLGYKPYHMYEVVCGGVTHMALFQEALECKFQKNGKRPYDKRDFDKWLANYDTVIEIPQFFTKEFIEYYPDAKFILTEREMASWTKSMNNTAGVVFPMIRRFPFTFVAMVDEYIRGFCALHHALEQACYHGKCTDPGAVERSERDTALVSEEAKALLPKEKLLVCRLEDGFGWEEICPFLDKEIPTERYPKGNAPAEFEKLFGSVTRPGFIKAGLVALTAVVVPVAGVAGWWFYGRQT